VKHQEPNYDGANIHMTVGEGQPECTIPPERACKRAQLERDRSFPECGYSVLPVEIGGEYGEVVGPITSTMMDGHAVALDSESILSGLVEIRAASLVGDAHIESGIKRQDAYAIHFEHETARIEVAVCDGVGSRTRSNEGAALVATTVADKALANNPDPVGEARSRLLQMAAAVGTPAIEYSTTLIWLEVIIGEPRKKWQVRLTQFGDGDVCLLNRENRLWRPVTTHSYLGESDMRSFALPASSYPRREFEFSWLPQDVLVVATDGLSCHLDSNTKVGDYLARSWYRPPNRWDFLNDVAFRTLGAGDDRTAVALWRIDVSPSYGEISVGYSKSY
jgi:hypothetical protein